MLNTLNSLEILAQLVLIQRLELCNLLLGLPELLLDTRVHCKSNKARSFDHNASVELAPVNAQLLGLGVVHPNFRRVQRPHGLQASELELIQLRQELKVTHELGLVGRLLLAGPCNLLLESETVGCTHANVQIFLDSLEPLVSDPIPTFNKLVMLRVLALLGCPGVLNFGVFL